MSGNFFDAKPRRGLAAAGFASDDSLASEFEASDRTELFN